MYGLFTAHSQPVHTCSESAAARAAWSASRAATSAPDRVCATARALRAITAPQLGNPSSLGNPPPLGNPIPSRAGAPPAPPPPSFEAKVVCGSARVQAEGWVQAEVVA